MKAHLYLLQLAFSARLDETATSSSNATSSVRPRMSQGRHPMLKD